MLLDNITAEEEKDGVPAKKDLVYGLVARKMNTSPKTIYRYQSLNKLIPKLKEFADEGVSWTALTQAAKLPEDKQELIALAISNELVENQAENITRPWIISLIARTSGQTDEPKSKTIVRSGAVQRLFPNVQRILTISSAEMLHLRILKRSRRSTI